MTDYHMKSFFGQSSAITIKSSSKEDPHFYIQCIKKKKDGDWQKPSKGEGKTIKCSLEELIMILQVLRKEVPTWSSFHSFNGTKTSISFAWDKDGEKRLWININKYAKSLGFPQVEILRLLLDHMLQEKIEYATKPYYQRKETSSSLKSRDSIKNKNDNENNGSTEIMIEEEKDINPLDASIQMDTELKVDEHFHVKAQILRKTEKALFLKFNSGIELWIPKSAIKSTYDLDSKDTQIFEIESWVIKKNLK